MNTKATNTKTLKDLFMSELAGMYDAEQRILTALPKLVDAATCEYLKEAFLSHMIDTEGHVTKLEQIFQMLGEKAKGQKCEAIVGLLAEADEIAAEFGKSPVINAALISAAQKVEHYETASYGCLHEWAGLLGHVEAAAILEEILEDEKVADATLTELAEARSNDEALGPELTGEASDNDGDTNRGDRRMV